MAIKNILLVTLLITLETCNYVHPEAQLEQEILPKNLTAILGKWYLLAVTYSNESANIPCWRIDIIEKPLVNNNNSTSFKFKNLRFLLFSAKLLKLDGKVK
ncbi:hypothetical protein PV328_001603 [Microctonus aethiopoides]|uniref:Lipocalin/cytosolic fatty-acid binding domain-containing protein n=1 Tax=Microctonus aethiopoides TaxID=144406 RepID=A0AA39FXA3_9HYME|nr:hypothetical protein PV328_001603 [Microctonus aethiopoides]